MILNLSPSNKKNKNSIGKKHSNSKFAKINEHNNSNSNRFERTNSIITVNKKESQLPNKAIEELKNKLNFKNSNSKLENDEKNIKNKQDLNIIENTEKNIIKQENLKDQEESTEKKNIFFNSFKNIQSRFAMRDQRTEKIKNRNEIYLYNLKQQHKEFKLPKIGIKK